MHQVWADVPKIRDELRGLAEVHAAEPWLAAMPVDMNMEHADLIAKGDLQGLSYCRRTHHCTHRAVPQVVRIGNRVKIVGQHYPSRWLQRTHPARQETNTLSSKWVRPVQVLANATEQAPRNLESDDHRNALRCWANISARRWLAGTLFQDHVCQVRLRITCVDQLLPFPAIRADKNKRVR